MKNYSIILLAAALSSCTSIRRHNEQRATCIGPDELKEDVDYAYLKLQQMHPQLYWYISKPELDRKFDSLKGTIDESLTPLQFYFKLQPVIVMPETHVQQILEYFMGKNTPERQEFIIENLKVELDKAEDGKPIANE